MWLRVKAPVRAAARLPVRSMIPRPNATTTVRCIALLGDGATLVVGTLMPADCENSNG